MFGWLTSLFDSVGLGTNDALSSSPMPTMDCGPVCNIDGTPMIPGTFMDVTGRTYGTSSSDTFSSSTGSWDSFGSSISSHDSFGSSGSFGSDW